MQALFTTVCMDAATENKSVGIPPSEEFCLSQRCGFGVRCRPAEIVGEHQTAGSLLGIAGLAPAWTVELTANEDMRHTSLYCTRLPVITTSR